MFGCPRSQVNSISMEHKYVYFISLAVIINMSIWVFVAPLAAAQGSEGSCQHSLTILTCWMSSSECGQNTSLMQ